MVLFLRFACSILKTTSAHSQLVAAGICSSLFFFSTLSCSAQSEAFEGIYKEANRAFVTGELETAETMFKTCADQAKNFTNPADFVRSLEGLGIVQGGLGKFEEAEKNLQIAIELRTRMSGADSVAVAVATTYLADVYRDEAKIKQAEILYLQCLPRLSAYPKFISQTENNLACCYEDDAKFSDAEEMFRKSLKIAREVYGEKSVFAAHELISLSNIYADQANYKKAEETVQQALTMLKEVAPDDQALFFAQNSLSHVYNTEGRTAEADALSRKTLSEVEAAFPPDSELVGHALLSLAEIYDGEQKYEAAEKLTDRAKQIFAKRSSAEKTLADVISAQASLMMHQGKYVQAQALNDQSLDIRKRLRGINHPSVGDNLEASAYIHQQLGDYVTAEAEYKRAQSIYLKAFGKMHPHFATVLFELGRLSELMKSDDEAETYLKQAFAIRQKVLPADNKELIRNMNELADFYRDHSRLEEAQALYQQMLDRDRNIPDAKGRLVADYDNIARVLLAQGKQAEASAAIMAAGQLRHTLPGADSAGASDVAKIALQQSKSSSTIAVSEKWCLAIGISNFKDAEINLKFAAKDATDFSNFLKTQGNFKSDHVKLLVDKDATRDAIIGQLGEQWLGKSAGPDDLVIIYISSHGSRSLEQAGGANFLVAYDTNKNALLSTGIPMQWLSQIIEEQVHSKHILLVLDVCHSGSAAEGANVSGGGTAGNGKSGVSPAVQSGGNVSVGSKGLARTTRVDTAKIPAGKGQAVLCSSSSDQVSWESKEYQNSVFTHRLIQGLQLKGPQTGLSDAFIFMHDQVQDEVLRDRGQVQTPILKETWTGGDVTPLN